MNEITPVHICLMLRIATSRDLTPPHLPVVAAALLDLVNAGMIRITSDCITGLDVYWATELGESWIRAMCLVPMPEKAKA